MADLKRYNAHKRAVSCPACGHSVSSVNYVWQDQESTSYLYVCGECTFIFARPVPIRKLADRHMDGTDNAELFGSRFLKKLYRKLFIGREINKIQKATTNEPRFLDVGCGTGWTTACYFEAGFDCVGVEPSEVRADFARKNYGLKIVSDYFEHCRFDSHFDIIMFRHIIEHFEDPLSMLTKAKDFLSENGLVFVVVPNINCLGRYMFGTKWSWILPIHCNFFSPKSIRAILNQADYDVVSCYQTPSPLYFPESLFRCIRSKKFEALFRKNKVFLTLLLAPFSILGCVLGFGDNLNVIAKTRS